VQYFGDSLRSLSHNDAPARGVPIAERACTRQGRAAPPLRWFHNTRSEILGTAPRASRLMCRQAKILQGDGHMDWNRVEGNWKQAKGKIKEKWGQLTDDDINQINGKRDQLEGRIQERYGLAKDMVRQNVDDWLKQQP
jgi:uncharacterized protein YjbJ (UPF0337 family)